MKRRIKILLAAASALCLFFLSACADVEAANGHTHSWVWKNDAKEHWQVCADDGTEKDGSRAAHADGNGDGACDVCGESVAHAAHVHAYRWVDNGDGTHKQHCANDGCDAPDIHVGAHVDRDKNGTCDECGGSVSITHTHAYRWVDNGDGTHRQHCEGSGCDAPDIGRDIHVDENNDLQCDLCKAGIVPTEGLAYEETEDGTGFAVTGIGSAPLDTKFLVIPATHEARPVVAIANFAFDNDSYSSASDWESSPLVTVWIPDSVKKVGMFAFMNNKLLSRVHFGEGLEEIGMDAFCQCPNLRKAILPDSLKTIRSGAFSTSGLLSLRLGTGLETISGDAFELCCGLKEVYNFSKFSLQIGSKDNGYAARYAADVWTENVQSKYEWVGDFAFYPVLGKSGLAREWQLIAYTGAEQTPTLPEQFEGGSYAIHRDAFAYNDAIVEVTVPDSVTSLGMEAFYTCRNLERVTLGDGVKSVGAYAFTNCDRLSGVDLGKGVEEIQTFAFAFCRSLVSLTLPERLQSIGEKAFNDCHKLVEIRNLSSLVLEEGQTSNGYVANYALHIMGAEDKSNLVTENEFVYYRDGAQNILLAYLGDEEEIVIPDTCTVWKATFYYHRTLKKVTLPKGISELPIYLFMGCNDLSEIVFQGSLEEWNALSKKGMWNRLTNHGEKLTIVCDDESTVA